MHSVVAKYRVTGTDHEGQCKGAKCENIDYISTKFMEYDNLKQIEVFNGCTCSRSPYTAIESCQEGENSQQEHTLIEYVDLTHDTKEIINVLIEQYNDIVHIEYTVKFEGSDENYAFNEFHNIMKTLIYIYETVCNEENIKDILEIENDYKNLIETQFMNTL